MVDSYWPQILIPNPAIQTDDGSVILLDASRQLPGYNPKLGKTSSIQILSNSMFNDHLITRRHTGLSKFQKSLLNET